MGIVDDDPAKQGMRFDGYKVLGTAADIPELVRRYDIGVIIFAINSISSEDSLRILSICRKTNRRVVIISDVLNSLHSHLTAQMPALIRRYPYPTDPDPKVLIAYDNLEEE